MQKYKANITSRRKLHDCEGVPYLKLFLDIEDSGITTGLRDFSFITYSFVIDNLKVGTELTVIGECRLLTLLTTFSSAEFQINPHH